MSLSTLEDVLYHGMKDLLSAEKQFRDALPGLADATEDADLAQAFRDHRDETVGQIERLERGFELFGRPERSEKCQAAAGLVAEAKSMIEEDGEAPAKDVALAGAGRKTEHYEIVSYTDAIEHAKTLGHDDLAQLLTRTLEEEQAADAKLASIAKRLASKATRVEGSSAGLN